jgi:hypothetical protein
MSESLNRKLYRWALNLVPAYAFTGARLLYIADDWSSVRLKIPLNRLTRNYVGTIFGGSMYGAVDPVYMLMLIKMLGPGYVVWDKSASIRFRKPGRSTLYAEFHLAVEEVEAIRVILETEAKTERDYVVELKDKDGVVHAVVEKKLHVAVVRGQ